jgi:D-alanine--poly(phosphoribitol) ligase subunit 1
VDHQVKVMGRRIELEELEAHLRQVCSTETVAAVAWPEEGGAPVALTAFVVGSPLSVADIRARLRERLPAYMVPRTILTPEALPLNSCGRKLLAQREGAHS